MRKIAVLLILAAMLFSTAAAFAGEGSSKGESGWQSVYDSIASWSWSSGKSSK